MSSYNGAGLGSIDLPALQKTVKASECVEGQSGRIVAKLVRDEILNGQFQRLPFERLEILLKIGRVARRR